MPSSMTIPQVNTTPIVPATPEKKTRAQSRKSSVASRSDEISDTTSVQQSITNEQIVLDTSINDDNLKVQTFVSKSIEEKPNDIEKLGEKSCLSSVGNSNAKLDSIVEAIPLSNEQQQIEEKQNPVKHVPNEVIDLSPDLKSATTKEQSKYSIICRMNLTEF